jgi:hypothetical protein
MSQQLSIYDIHNEINRRKEIRTKSYKKVLEVCENKIRTASEKELFKIYIDVPEFIIGLPIYDISDCIKYITANLEKNGFLVQYYFPKTLYVSWDLDEINKNDSQQDSKSSQHFKTLPYNAPALNDTDKMLLTSRATHVIQNNNNNMRKRINVNSSKSLQYRPNGKFVLNLD